MDMDEEDKNKQHINALPYPPQANIIKHLLSSSDDILNLTLAVPSFKDVANITKTTWIFDKILLLLLPYLTKNDFLKCRLVCETWKQTADKFIQNLGLEEPDYSKPKPYSRELESWSRDAFGWRSVWIQNSDDISEFMETLGTHSGNPFISRCVQINNRRESQYWEDVLEFLKRFGQEIWKLRLGCYCAFSKATVIVRNILTLVPNVRVLSLEFNGVSPNDLTADEEREIQQDLAETPFPQLPDLKFVEWNLCPDFYRVAFHNYSQQLVQAEFSDDFFMYYDRAVHGTFPNLKSLVVRITVESDLQELIHMGSPLKTVTTVTDQRIPLFFYFQAFQTFSDTLESANIEFHEEPLYPEEEQSQLPDGFQNQIFDFPKLNCLRLENPDPTESFDILLSLKSGPSTLQIVTYSDWEPNFREYQEPLFQKMPGETTQVHGYLHKMYESKIWELLPQLDIVDVKAAAPLDQRINTIYKRADLQKGSTN